MSTKIVKKLLAADVIDFIQLKADTAQSNSETYTDQKVADLVNSAPAILDTLSELATAINNDASFASTIAGQIGALDGRLDTAEAELITQDGRLDTAEGNISTLQSDVSTLQSDVSALQGVQGNYLNKAGDTMSGPLNMGTNDISNAGAVSAASVSADSASIDGISIIGDGAAGLEISGDLTVTGALASSSLSVNGQVDVQNHKIVNVAAPAAAGDAANMGYVDGEISTLSSTLSGDISGLDGRLTTAEGDIVALEGRMTTAEGDIDLLEGRMTTAEGDIDALEGRMTTAEGDIDALESRMTTAEGDIDALEGRMTTAESDIAAIQGDYGVAGGLATLDMSGKVPVSQLPSAVMEFKGTWDASSNTPTLADGPIANAADDAGHVYKVSVAGTVNFGNGPISFNAGDLVILSAALHWEKSVSGDQVDSVNGYQGVVVLKTNDIEESAGAVDNRWFTAAREAALEAYGDAAVLVEKNRAEAAEGVIAGNLAQEILDRIADVGAEQTRAEGAEGVIAGNLAQEILDRIADVGAEQTRAEGAEGVIAANLAQEILDRIADVNAEQSRAEGAEGVIAANLAQEILDRIADVNAEQSRAELAEAALAAEDLTFLKLNGSRAMTQDMDMGGNVITGLGTPLLSDDAATKAYVDSASSAAVSDAAYDEAAWNGVAAVAPSKNAVRDEIEAFRASVNAAALVGVKSARTLDGDDIAHQYWDLAHTVHANTLIVVFRGLVLEEDVDYSLSVVGGVTRVAFLGDFASAGDSALVSGDRLRFQYLRPQGA